MTQRHIVIVRSALAVFSLLWATLCGVQAFASAEADLITRPESVTLSPGGNDRFTVSLHGNGSRSGLLQVDVPPAVKASVEPIKEGGRFRKWIVRLEASTDFVEDGTAILRANNDGHIVTGTIPVKIRQAPTLASQIGMQLSFEGETLLDGVPQPLLVQVSNLADGPVQIALKPQLPPFIKAGGDDWKRNRLIAPRSTVVIEIPLSIEATADHPLQSGKHQIAVAVRAIRTTSPRWSGEGIAATTLPVGVPGMNDIQGVLQIPSFLIIPGFLLVTAFYLMRRFSAKGRAASDEEKSGLSVPWSSGLWALAITLSMCIIPFYTVLSRLIGLGPRNILRGYDLLDVMMVWFLSIALGILSALAAQFMAKRRANRRALSEFALDLSPLEFLDRMDRLNRSTAVEFVTLDDEDDSRVFRLGGELGNGRTWATTAIVCKLINPSSPEFDRRALTAMIKSNHTHNIRQALTLAIEQGGVHLEWHRTSIAYGLAQLDASMFIQTEKPGSIIILR